jgi:rare lipoprotein A
MIQRRSAAILLLIATVGAASAQAESGIASVYPGGGSADGDGSNADRMTAAHRSLPFGTKVRVTNRRNGNSVVVRISDRGPFHRGRLIDLAPDAAAALGVSGLAAVTITVIGH